jgi:hypothetical protein
MRQPQKVVLVVVVAAVAATPDLPASLRNRCYAFGL